MKTSSELQSEKRREVSQSKFLPLPISVNKDSCLLEEVNFGGMPLSKNFKGEESLFLIRDFLCDILYIQ